MRAAKKARPRPSGWASAPAAAARREGLAVVVENAGSAAEVVRVHDARGMWLLSYWSPTRLYRCGGRHGKVAGWRAALQLARRAAG